MSDMAKYPGLVKRGNVFYFRRRVPDHLVEAHGSREIMVSLKTTDRKEAEDAWLLEHAKAKDAFERLAEQPQASPPVLPAISEPPPPPARGSRFIRSRTELIRRARRAGAARHLPPLDAQTIDTLVALWKSSAVEGCLAQMPPSPPDEAIREREHEIGELSASDLDARLRIERTADTILNHHELSGVPGEPMYERFCERLRLAMLEVMRFDLARLRGETALAPESPSLAVTAKAISVQSGKLTSSRTSLRLDDVNSVEHVSNKFLSWYKGENPNLKPHSLERIEKGLSLAAAFFGKDAAIDGIDTETCESYRQFLRDLPPNAEKIRGGRSLLEMVEEARINNVQGLASATRAGYFGTFKRLMDWAAQRKLIPFNPASTVREKYPKGRGDGQQSQYSYTLDQLRRVFAAPLYVGCENDGRGFNTPGPNHPRRGRFWVPLLGLFTGARLGELCQLRPQDILMSEMGVPYFRIHGEGVGMSVKNEGSWRSVPLHPELQRIGFLDFVSQARDEGRVNLFPEMLVEGRMSGYRFSKLYAYFLKSIKVKVRGLVYHSFRHTLRDAMRECDIERELAEELCGWNSDDKVSNRYGEGSSMERLYRHLCRTSYIGLDLSFLYTGASAVKPPSPRKKRQIW